MKKTILLWVALFTLGATATLIFAQTATGASVIDRMKAASQAFTLAGDLNPGKTGLQSSPVAGKETGDMLTAAEWNRVLELVAQGGGGGGGFEVNDATTKTRYSIIWNGISWANNPKHMAGIGGDYTSLADCGIYFAGTLTSNCKMIETAAHDFCQIVFTGGGVSHAELNYIGAKKWRIISSGFASFTNGTIVECYDNAGGGTGGGTTPPPAAPACTVRSFSLACSNQAPNYSCENARTNCRAQPGYISANDDGNGVNRHIDCTVCQ